MRCHCSSQNAANLRAISNYQLSYIQWPWLPLPPARGLFYKSRLAPQTNYFCSRWPGQRKVNTATCFPPKIQSAHTTLRLFSGEIGCQVLQSRKLYLLYPDVLFYLYNAYNDTLQWKAIYTRLGRTRKWLQLIIKYIRIQFASIFIK